MRGVEQELPTPAWGHASGALAMREPAVPTESSPAIDRVLIAERPSRYCWGYDERRSDLLAACFTHDAVWEGTVGGAQRVGPLSGRDRIIDWLSGFWPHQHHQARHVLLGTLIETHGEERATALSYLLLTTARRGRVAISTTGFYRLRLVRDGEAWRIAHLFAGFDAPFWPGRLERLSERGRARHGLFGDAR